MNQAPNRVRTERCTLFRFHMEDAKELLELFQTPYVRRFLLDDQLVDRAWLLDEIGASEARFAAGSIGLYTARLTGGDHRIIGFVGFRPFFDPPRLQLLYGLHTELAGQGLATEIAQAVINVAFDRMGFDEALASVDEANERSSRVLARLGFREIEREVIDDKPTIHYRRRAGRLAVVE